MLGISDHFPGTSRCGGGHGHMIFLILAGWDGIQACRPPKTLVLRDNGRRSGLQAHEPSPGPLPAGMQEGLRQRCGQQAIESAFREVRHFADGDLEVVCDEADMFAMKKVQRSRL